jgi:hypothetical protein
VSTSTSASNVLRHVATPTMASPVSDPVSFPITASSVSRPISAPTLSREQQFHLQQQQHHHFNMMMQHQHFLQQQQQHHLLHQQQNQAQFSYPSHAMQPPFPHIQPAMYGSPGVPFIHYPTLGANGQQMPMPLPTAQQIPPIAQSSGPLLASPSLLRPIARTESQQVQSTRLNPAVSADQLASQPSNPNQPHPALLEAATRTYNEKTRSSQRSPQSHPQQAPVNPQLPHQLTQQQYTYPQYHPQGPQPSYALLPSSQVPGIPTGPYNPLYQPPPAQHQYHQTSSVNIGSGSQTAATAALLPSPPSGIAWPAVRSSSKPLSASASVFNPGAASFSP